MKSWSPSLAIPCGRPTSSVLVMSPCCSRRWPTRCAFSWSRSPPQRRSRSCPSTSWQSTSRCRNPRDVLAAYRPTGKGRVERQVAIVRDHVVTGRRFWSPAEIDGAFTAWVPIRRTQRHRTHDLTAGRAFDADPVGPPGHTSRRSNSRRFPSTSGTTYATTRPSAFGCDQHADERRGSGIGVLDTIRTGHARGSLSPVLSPRTCLPYALKTGKPAVGAGLPAQGRQVGVAHCFCRVVLRSSMLRIKLASAPQTAGCAVLKARFGGTAVPRR